VIMKLNLYPALGGVKRPNLRGSRMFNRKEENGVVFRGERNYFLEDAWDRNNTFGQTSPSKSSRAAHKDMVQKSRDKKKKRGKKGRMFQQGKIWPIINLIAEREVGGRRCHKRASWCGRHCSDSQT